VSRRIGPYPSCDAETGLAFVMGVNASARQRQHPAPIISERSIINVNLARYLI
jgi:hypothetical protein